MTWPIVDTLRLLARRFGPGAGGETERLRATLAEYTRGWPPGHFYSPIPSLEQVREREARIWPPPPRTLAGIDLREAQQLELLDRLVPYYAEQPWTDERREGLRYQFDNPNFSYGESIFLYALLRHLKPARMIEIGSGHSSCATLDTNDRFLDGSMKVTFIEPYPQLLESLMLPGDRASVEMVASAVQDVPTDSYASLEAGDVLFVDSTHVAKVGSDVNHILFEVLPSLRSGVYVHFHDIYFPFEYPKEWVYQGRAWNEAYVLRAFLQHNDAYEIVLFGSFLSAFHRPWLAERMPLVARNPGSSLWLRKR
jgi:hypothetical protein